MTGQDELIAGRYRLVARIGHGAMGVVWRADDERLDRTVAVKQLLPDPDELAGDGTHREGRVAARLRHPHAVMVHDAVEHDGRRYLVMEYFPSSSLAARLTADDVARIGRQVAAALAAAHGEGIVHRDVKPANVLVDPDGRAKIADFGISRALGDGTMTGGAILVGTPAYLAPEVAAGEAVGFSSDVFAFGATLYTALEGTPPFGLDDNPIAMLRRVASAAIRPPHARGPLVDVVLWMLRRNPGERPTMREAYQALDAVLDGRPTGAPKPEPEPEPAASARTARRRRLAGAGLGALALVTLGVLLGSLIPARVVTVVTADPHASDPPPAGPTTSLTLAPPATGTARTATSNPPSPSSPSGTGEPSTSDTPAVAPAPGGCSARYAVTNAWPGGYQAEITVNTPGPAIAGWAVRWALPAGHTITNLWRGTLQQDGSAVTVVNLDYNGQMAANGSTTFGLTANAPPGPDALIGEIPVLNCQSR
ncbi:MAG TPA: protein kinase [Actinophytocola sp.]|uniref:serine/threonine-protein kinase n=1 Tax=Actinophytocola sp. TaxID=1872138 RepID=UPI002DBB2C26|nr:protein kinase [Actinophytocola sp.]HEU5472532.1 protein kinase [Actinophytocola sp.]